MNKTIALVLTTAVIGMTAALVMFIGSSSLDGLSDDTDRLSDEECQFQKDQARRDLVKKSDVDDKCWKTGDQNDKDLSPPDDVDLGAFGEGG